MLRQSVISTTFFRPLGGVWTKRGVGHGLGYGVGHGLPYGLPYGPPYGLPVAGAHK